MVNWFVCSFSYYAVVLFTTELAIQRNAAHSPSPQSNASSIATSGGDSGEGTVTDCSDLLTMKDFVGVFLAAMAEIPGIIACMLVVDRLGRRKSQALFFTAGFLSVIILWIVPRSLVGDSVLLFLARGATLGAFTVLFVYTPERYPTTIRATSMGIFASFGRFGGMLAPFVAVDMVEQHQLPLAFSILCGSLFLAIMTSLLLEVETANKPLTDEALRTTSHARSFTRLSEGQL